VPRLAAKRYAAAFGPQLLKGYGWPRRVSVDMAAATPASAAASSTIKAPKQLPAPNSDFYRLVDFLTPGTAQGRTGVHPDPRQIPQ
jgi:hypothetical protein